MCGINYIQSLSNTTELRALNRKTHHRGPDYSAIIEKVHDHKYHFLGHNRLAIRDLDSRSNQPYSLENDKVLIYNGEIYNFDSVKTLIKQALPSIEFKTNSDTELMYLIFAHNLFDILDHVDGMYALVFYNKGDIYYCRDYMGIKPLYAYEEGGEKILSSEIKFIKSVIDARGLPYMGIDRGQLVPFLLQGFTHKNKTGFIDINLVDRGVVFKNFKPHKILKPFFDRLDVDRSLKESIIEQSEADVDTGILFSGGIDSSLLSCLSHPNALHVIGVSNEADVKKAGMSADAEYATLIAEYYDKKTLKLKVDSQVSVFNKIDEVVLGNEELCSDITYLISRDLCLAAKNKGISVLLSGMGADEFFMGYSRYKLFKYRLLFSSFKAVFSLIKPMLIMLPSMRKKTDRFIDFLCQDSDILRYFSVLSNFRFSEIDKLMKDDSVTKYIERTSFAGFSLNLKDIQKFELDGFLKHNLIVADKSSMAASVELRVPFLSCKLFNAIADIDLRREVSILSQKKSLKTILFQSYKERFFKRAKAGFNPPMDQLINSINDAEFNAFLDENNKYQRYLHREQLSKLFSEHQRTNNTYKIWQVLFLVRWIELNDV